MSGPEHLVGILGGMGPAATAEFYAKLIRRTPVIRDQDHLRVAIWADPTVPDRVGAVLGGTTDPYPAMLEGARRLRDLGVTVSVMPCHTAHVFLPALVGDSGLRFLDMVAETVAELERRPGTAGGIGLLGTRATLASGLYQNRLRAERFDVVLPEETTQWQVDLAIKKVKQGNPRAAGQHLDNAVRAMARTDASTIVLACTELPLAARHLTAAGGPALLDPTDLLADAVIRECHGTPPAAGGYKAG
ncbi:amino acid racemase [Streptomyces coelicoflavus]|uniref:aspartate/glutamate racemase family protein n=1 Tax=Streptomyces coelicoflavus TaxID=285562 RepID=UPI0024AD62E1|nr:amino acid racemase [Streptomyces coelicoflavus]MDI6521450.1 amino acid racemase [Streptomyces coelicoflavus]